MYISTINDRLKFQCDAYDKISESQAGFRAGYSTVDNIYILQSITHSVLSKKGKLYDFFVDFKKGVWVYNRSNLWPVLQHKGGSPKMLGCIRSIYDCLKSRVKLDISYSEMFECNIGVRQGCVLSPYLFSIFMNELADKIVSVCYPGIQLNPELTQMFLLLYADDVTLFS